MIKGSVCMDNDKILVYLILGCSKFIRVTNLVYHNPVGVSSKGYVPIRSIKIGPRNERNTVPIFTRLPYVGGRLANIHFTIVRLLISYLKE
jgi:hypothetical protein